MADKVFGKYILLDLLGQGGFAAVYKARHAETGEIFALKILDFKYSQDETSVRRFEREATLNQKLSHPHILPVLEFSQVQRRYYLLMPYMTGGSLQEYFTKPRQVSLKISLLFLEQVADALDYAHQQGVIHRDLKLANIMLEKPEHLRLGDFGIAKLLDGTRYTATQQLIGTPHYMSPEQIEGDPTDHRTDLYGLGVMAYLMLTGSFPFNGDDPISIIQKHLNDIPALPNEINPHLPKAMNPVLLRNLAKEPQDRYPTAKAFIQALRKAAHADLWDQTTVVDLKKITPSTKKRPKPASTNKRLVIGGLGVLLILIGIIIALVVLLLTSDDSAQNDPQPTALSELANPTETATEIIPTEEATAEITPTEEPPATTATNLPFITVTSTEEPPTQTPSPTKTATPILTITETTPVQASPTQPSLLVSTDPTINRDNIAQLQATSHSYAEQFYYLDWSVDSQFLMGLGETSYFMHRQEAALIEGLWTDNYTQWLDHRPYQVGVIQEGIFKIWDFGSKQYIFSQPILSTSPIWAAAPQANLIATTFSENDRAILGLWDSTTGQRLTSYPLPSQTSSFFPLIWSPQGNYIALIDTFRIAIFNLTTQETYQYNSPPDFKFTLPAFSWDDRFFAYVNADNQIILIDLTTGEPAKSFQAPVYTFVLTWSPEGYLASGGLDGVIQIWDGSETPLVTLTDASLNMPEGNILSDLQWSPDGTIIAALTSPVPLETNPSTAAGNTILTLWDIRN